MTDYLADMWRLALDGDKQGIVFFAALYTAIALSVSVVYQLRVRAWPSTRGKLVEARVSKFGATDPVPSEQEYVASALYEYRVAGKTYQGTRVSPWILVASHNLRFMLARQLRGLRRRDGDTVDVIYKPSDPRKSYLRRPGIAGLLFSIALAVAPLLLYWQHYHA